MLGCILTMVSIGSTPMLTADHFSHLNIIENAVFLKTLYLIIALCVHVCDPFRNGTKCSYLRFSSLCQTSVNHTDSMSNTFIATDVT